MVARGVQKRGTMATAIEAGQTWRGKRDGRLYVITGLGQLENLWAYSDPDDDDEVVRQVHASWLQENAELVSVKS